MKTAKLLKTAAEGSDGKFKVMARWSAYVFAAVLVLLPFHAFLTVALADQIGNYDLLRLWKEMVLLVLLVPVGLILWRRPEVWARLRSGWLWWCLLAYAVLHVALGLIALQKGQVNTYALLYALIVNLRLLLVFVVGFVLAAAWPSLQKRWHKLLLWPAALVLAFGLLQLTVLPPDFLKNFGYGADTIAPYSTVDQKEAYVRIQSSLRGANPLGAYLVLIIGALVTLLQRDRRQKQQLVGVTLLSAAVIILVATYSRSAYIGAVVAVVVAVGLVLRAQRARRLLAAGLATGVLLAGTAGLVLRENDHFENIFFHTNEHSQSTASSNASRLSALEDGSNDALREPFGRGPGTAGPASAHNVQPARIAENYYVQLAQEVGWLGLVLFVVISLAIARRLWWRRDELLPRVLLASLVGVAVINLVQHAWTDDTLGLLWWGLAGVALSVAATTGNMPGNTPAIITSNAKQNTNKHGKTKVKKTKQARAKTPAA